MSSSVEGWGVEIDKLILSVAPFVVYNAINKSWLLAELGS